MEDKIKQRFLQEKGGAAILYMKSHSYTTADGKTVCVFENDMTKRTVQVYLNEKDILMPYFPEG